MISIVLEIMKNCWAKYKEVIAIAIIAVLLGVFYVLVVFCNLQISDSDVALGFFGILATFVVIGNYAQVSNIKNQMDQSINNITDESRDNTLASKVNNLYDAFGRPKYELEINAQITKALENVNKEYNKDLKVIFDFMLKNQHKDFLSDILSQKEVKCKIYQIGENNEKTARAKLEGLQIVFRDGRRNIITDIIRVDKKEYDAATFNRIVKWWLQNDQSNISAEAINIIFGDNPNVADL